MNPRLQAGRLLLPRDGIYDRSLAERMRTTLEVVPYLDDMGFDSYHPPVWRGPEKPPAGSKEFRYAQVVAYLAYFMRRDHNKTAKHTAHELRASARTYMAKSETLSQLLHPYGTYGELTLAAMISGLTVLPNSNPKCIGHCYSPIIHVGGYLPEYQVRKGVAP